MMSPHRADQSPDDLRSRMHYTNRAGGCVQEGDL